VELFSVLVQFLQRRWQLEILAVTSDIKDGKSYFSHEETEIMKSEIHDEKLVPDPP
jgi:hypothetical protein